MNESTAASTPGGADTVGPYSVYVAGGLFTQDELTMNVMLKEAIWRLSGGKFQLFLPQSRELQELDRPDVEPFIRNTDLLEVLRADILLARFDGVELDSGTVVEYMVAKSLGKPAVILRSDFRRLAGTGLSEPYNLMVKNWPRTVNIHIDSYVFWAGLLVEERSTLMGSDAFQVALQAELGVVRKSVDQIAARLIAGFEDVIKMQSPYPLEHRQAVYRAFRFSPGSGFDQLLTPTELDEIIQRLEVNGTL